MSSPLQITDKNSVLTITLHKAKYISDKEKPGQYSLYIQFNNDKVETEKILEKEKVFENTIYNFSFTHETISFNPITFTAYTSSWIVLSTVLASLSIPLTINKLNSQRQWYYLKNENDENILSILVSFSTNILFHNKTELSFNNQNQSNILHSLLNRTTIYPNSTKHTSYESGLLRKKNSYNVSNLYLDNSFNYKNSISFENVSELLTEKSKKLESIEEKIRIQNLNGNLAYEKIKDRENILRRERKKLEEKVKRYNINHLEYETKYIRLKQNIKQFEKEQNRFLVVKSIMEYNNDFYRDLNFVYLSGIDANDILLPKKDLIIKEQNNTTIISKQKKQIKTHIPRVDNPSKKSNSTRVTSSNVSEVSLNEYNPMKSHPVTQIYLNTNENETIKNRIIEPLESETNQIKRRTITNKSTLENHTITEGNATQRKSSLNSSQRRNSKGRNSNLCIANQIKNKKQGLSSIPTHKQTKFPLQNKNSLFPSSYRHNLNVKSSLKS